MARSPIASPPAAGADPELYATATPGLERILEAECRAAGLVVRGVEVGGVTLAGGAEPLYRAHLELRTASRIVARVASFHARLFPELVRHARQVPWQTWIRPGAALTFRVTSRKSRLYHQDAIAERLAASATERVPRLRVVRSAAAVGAGLDTESDGDEHAAQLFIVRVFRDRVTISVDASGALLHRRGYRLATTRAPLRETLAAAMLLESGWDGTVPLVDPMAGSGTIAIEAALLARRVAPGLNRRFAFERWPSFEPAVWERLVGEARARVLARAPAPILGFDRDDGAVAAARANAERAGVGADVQFARGAISALPAASRPTHVVTNPPYGSRVGDPRLLQNLYARLGRVFADRYHGSTLTILVGSLHHRYAIGVPMEERFRTTNGGLPVRCFRSLPQASVVAADSLRLP